MSFLLLPHGLQIKFLIINYEYCYSVSEKYNISNPLRLSHCLGQVAHETQGFTHFVENLNYTHEAGLYATFPTHFPAGLAVNYVGQPEKIANRVYAERMGNGDESSGDGWKYRGRGCFQLTGKTNYYQFGQTVTDNLIDNPDLVATHYALLSAAWFWNKHSLNFLAVKGGAD